MLGQSAVKFLSLSVGEGKGLRIISDAIPNCFNELDTLLNTEAQNLFKLGWAHGAKSSWILARTQSAVRITLA